MEPTQTYQLIPECCPCGCRQLSELQCSSVHQYIELPPIFPKVQHSLQCSVHILRSHLSATLVELLGVHGDSRRLVQDFVFSVFGIPISQGALQKIVERASAALQPQYAAIEHGAHWAQVNFIDKTSWKRGKKLCWLWLMVSNVFAFFKIHPMIRKAKATSESPHRDIASCGTWGYVGVAPPEQHG